HRRMRMAKRVAGMYKEYYIYTFESVPLTAGNGTVFTDVSTRFDSDADFEIIKRIHVATNQQIRVRYQDDSYGRVFQNRSMDLRGVSGTPLETSGVVDVGISTNNWIPYILPRPYLVRAGTSYTASYSDFSGVTNSIRESFHGAKVRP